MDTSTSIANLEKIRSSDQCILGGPKVEVLVDGLLCLVRGLHEGIGITTSKIITFDAFYKKCVQQMENFLFVDQHIPDGPFTETGRSRRIFGREALEYEFAAVSRKMKCSDSSSEVYLADIRQLRTFDWILTDNQRAQREKWMDFVLQGTQRVHVAVKDKSPDDDEEALGHDDRASAVGTAMEISGGLSLIKAAQSGDSSPKKTIATKFDKKRVTHKKNDAGSLMRFFAHGGPSSSSM